MSPLQTDEFAAASTGTEPREMGETPTPWLPVGRLGGESVTPLSSLSNSVLTKNETKTQRNDDGAEKNLAAQEDAGSGSYSIGARISPALRAQVEDLGGLLRLELSDVVRNALALYLQAHGVDQGARITAEALADAKARLEAYEAHAKALIPNASPQQALMQVRQAATPSPYRVAVFRALSSTKDGAEKVATVVRMWGRPDGHNTIQQLASLEGHKWAPSPPPLLSVFHKAFGSWVALRDALVTETGVPA